MIRLSFFCALWLLSASCSGRQDHLAAARPDKEAVLEIAPQTQNNRGEAREHNEASASQPLPPASIEPPASLNEWVYQMPNGASIKIRLRPGALYEELTLSETQPLSILNLEFLKLWVETIAHDAGLQIQSVERERQELSQQAAIHFVTGIESSSNPRSTNAGLAFLRKLKQPTQDSFKRAVARMEERKNQRRTQAKEILLLNLKEQLELRRKRIIRYDLLACELETWLGESLLLWNYPLQDQAIETQTAELQTLSSELVKLTSEEQNPKPCVLDSEIFKLRSAWFQIPLAKLQSRILQPKVGTGSLLLLVMPAQQDAEVEKHIQQWLKDASLKTEQEPTQHQLRWISGDDEALKAAYTELQVMLSKTSQLQGIVLLAVEKPEKLRSLP